VAPVRTERGLARVAMRNAASTAVMRLSAVVVGMILTPFVLGHLGRELYGVVVTATSAYEYLALLRGGMGAAMRRYVTLHFHAGRPALARRYYAVGLFWSTALRIGIVAIGALLARPLCDFLHIPPSTTLDAAWGIFLMILAAVIGDFSGTLEIPIYSSGRTHALANLKTVMGWGRIGIVVLIFTTMGASIRTYGLALIVTEVIPLFVILLLTRRSGVVGSRLPLPIPGDAAIRREVFQYGSFAILTQVAGLLYVSADNLLIGRFFGAGEVTRYALGTRWSPLILGFLVSTLSSLTPIFTQLEARGESKRSRGALARVVSMTASLAVPFCLAPCVVGDLFLEHWVGAEYRSSSLFMIAMLAPATIEASLAPVWMALIARGRIRAIALGDVVVAVANVVLSLFLAFTCGLGLLGFALGNTMALLAKNLLLRPIVGRKDPDFPPITEFLRPLPRALAGGAPALALLYFARPLYDGNLAEVILAGLVGGALCLAGSSWAAMGPSGIRDLRKALRARRPGGTPPPSGSPVTPDESES